MVILRPKMQLLSVLSLSLFAAAAYNIFLPQENVSAYSYYCKTDACHAAEDAYNAALEKSAAAKATINTLNGQIAALEAEIAELEASIRVDRALVADLRSQIAETEAKIAEQEQALAELLIESHFETDADAILILAGSSSISELAEKTSRQETVKAQISLSLDAITRLKQSLESQKAIADQKVQEELSKKSQIAAKKSEIEVKRSSAKSKKSAADADAAAQKKILDAAKKAADEAAAGSSGVYVNGYYNNYKWRNYCPGSIDSFLTVGGYVCECVSYTGWKVLSTYGISISAWGNALDWDESARRAGYRVDNNPEPGSVAVSHYGGYGHVMWVESVNRNGTINITEYNYKYGQFTAREGVSIYGNYGYSGTWHRNYSYSSYLYTKYSTSPAQRGYKYQKDYLYFIHFK